MKNVAFLLIFFVASNIAAAQGNKQISIAFINATSAYPFSQFGKLLTGIEHPGIELGYSSNWKTKAKHDWFQEFKFGYFNHRFVQNAFTLYTDIGYRYKFSPGWTIQIAIGAGYLHSIPATAKLKLDNSGEYKNNKGMGRAQALAILNFGTAYILHPAGKRPLRIFVTYQQFLQTPFVKAYVPILPYNSLLVGVGISLHSHKTIRS